MASNTKEFGIELMSIPKEQLKDMVRGLLHSIFFHRLLVHVEPKEINILNTTVSTTDSGEVDALIEFRANELLGSLRTNAKEGKIAVLFYEKRERRSWFPLNRLDELVCWERWTITLGMAYPKDDEEQKKMVMACEQQLSQCLLTILKLANDHKEHLPSITIINGNPFPFKIVVPSKSESWSAMMRRLLVTDTTMADH